jgi:hypothetical protein
MMKRQLFPGVVAVLVAGGLLAGAAFAATQTITASTRNGGSTPGSATATSASRVTCTQASGATAGTIPRCSLQAPGWNGVVEVGKSIGTTGAGNVVLNCNGSYPANGGLSCTAQIDDTVCTASQTISGSASGGSSYRGLAAVKANATIQCVSATGGTGGTTCGIQAPGANASMTAGQTITSSGPGTVALSCGGQYPASGGGLNCTAQITQVCP